MEGRDALILAVLFAGTFFCASTLCSMTIVQVYHSISVASMADLSTQVLQLNV